MRNRAFFVTAISPPQPVSMALLMFSLFQLFSLAGYLTFCTSPAQADLLPGGAAMLQPALGFFAQAQILMGAGTLLWFLRPYLNRTVLFGSFFVFASSLAIETLGVISGIPFGTYSYSSLLGVKIAGAVPYTIPLSWWTVTLAAYLWVSIRIPHPKHRMQRIAVVSLVLLAWDLSLDPAMSQLQPYWIWETQGLWFGVPLLNLWGWYLSGLLFAAIFEFSGLRSLQLRHRQTWISAFLVLQFLMPLGMVFTSALWPAGIASMGLALLLYFWTSRSKHISPVHDKRHHDQKNFMAQNSRSFYFASRFISPGLREIVTGIYTWCRLSDDLVDQATHQNPAILENELDQWEDLAFQAYQGKATGNAVVDKVFMDMGRKQVPMQYAQDLLNGMRMDLHTHEYKTLADLSTYTYRVAGAIGCWLTEYCNIDNPWILHRAAALGHAMQLTNILRDVGDDLRMGRVYIPQDLLEKHGITPQTLFAYEKGWRPIDQNWRNLVDELIAVADSQYKLAFEGMASLPVDFRRSVAIAAKVYQGIHHEIRNHQYNNFTQRAVTPTWRKLFLAIQGLVELHKHLHHTPPLSEKISTGAA